MNWYYARGRERMGPVDDAQFRQLVGSGTINDQTLVWREGMADWSPLFRVAHSPVTAPAGGDDAAPNDAGLLGALACGECGRPFHPDDMVAYEGIHLCAECKPIFFQRLREGGFGLAQFHYGGFWIRACAAIADSVITYIISLPLSYIQGWLISARGGFEDPSAIFFVFAVSSVVLLLSIALTILYDGLFVGKFGATPGKMMLGLKVIRSDGSRVTYGRAFGRAFATLLSAMTLMIGFIIAAFDREKRALHDHICDTRVVYR